MRSIINKKSVKLLIVIVISIFMISISTTIYAKYIFQNEFYIANLNIDRTRPKIEVISVENSNLSYESYANKTHVITIKVKIIDKNIKDILLDDEHVKIKIDEQNVESASVKCNKIEDILDGVIYQIELSNLQGNGALSLDILEGSIVDISELKSELLEINTDIIIDNIAPKGDFAENKISDEKVNAVINLNEEIKELAGWNFSEDKLEAEKEFTNNISYELPIVDYAGNETIIDVNITQATNIDNFKLNDYSQFSFVYQVLIDEIGWIAASSDGQECMYDKEKTMLTFRIAIVPKTEKQYVIDTWNKDVGTFNMK